MFRSISFTVSVRIWAVRLAAALACCVLVDGCGADRTLVPETREQLAWLEDASASWAAVGVTPVAVSAHGSVNVHVVDDIDAACGESTGPTTLGCTHFDPLGIYLSSAIPEALLVRTVRHEMGHAIRGDGEHLSIAEGCLAHGRGPFMMCAAPAVEDPTHPDVAFIEGSE